MRVGPGISHTACIHTYIHTYIIHTYLHTYIHTSVHPSMHPCIHTYIQTYIITYTHRDWNTVGVYIVPWFTRCRYDLGLFDGSELSRRSCSCSEALKF